MTLLPLQDLSLGWVPSFPFSYRNRGFRKPFKYFRLIGLNRPYLNFILKRPWLLLVILFAVFPGSVLGDSCNNGTKWIKKFCTTKSAGPYHLPLSYFGHRRCFENRSSAKSFWDPWKTLDKCSFHKSSRYNGIKCTSLWEVYVGEETYWDRPTYAVYASTKDDGDIRYFEYQVWARWFPEPCCPPSEKPNCPACCQDGEWVPETEHGQCALDKFPNRTLKNGPPSAPIPPLKAKKTAKGDSNSSFHPRKWGCLDPFPGVDRGTRHTGPPVRPQAGSGARSLRSRIRL